MLMLIKVRPCYETAVWRANRVRFLTIFGYAIDTTTIIIIIIIIKGIGVKIAVEARNAVEWIYWCNIGARSGIGV